MRQPTYEQYNVALSLGKQILDGSKNNLKHFREYPATYVLTNRENGKVYVGSSHSPVWRIYRHLMGNTGLQEIVNKDTWQDFDIQIFPRKTIEEAQRYEAYLIEALHAVEDGYNKKSEKHKLYR